jgi:hypothetical protein
MIIMSRYHFYSYFSLLKKTVFKTYERQQDYIVVFIKIKAPILETGDKLLKIF